MRLPRKITIRGSEYTVKRDKSKGTGYGRGRTDLKTITIGSKGDPEQVVETFIHEVMELTLLENDLRYERDGTNEFMYQMTHTEFNGYVRDIVKALRPFIDL